MESQWIFISSSGDLGATRKRIRDDLEGWLSSFGVDHLIAPFLWEDDREDRSMLTDRISIQEQLPDTAYSSVALTVCLFGERCGLPLQDKIPTHWEERIASWRAGPDGAGIVHPWPNIRSEQNKVLERGGFPLTGTTFELISAVGADPDRSDLIIAYVAFRPVVQDTELAKVDFGGRRLWDRLTAHCNNSDERDRVNEDLYRPQVHALLNLLKFLSRNHNAGGRFASTEEMLTNILKRTKRILRKRFGFTSLDNPFKSTLEHWGLNDRHELPGRAEHLREILPKIRANPNAFTLLRGRSGCGKSSLLQRGVMAQLRDAGDLVLPVRPTEIEPAHDGEDYLDALFDLLTDAVGCSMERKERSNISRRSRPERLAKFLAETLERQNQKLVLGLDQFEEMLDELHQFNDANGRSQGWWLVMRFLAYIAPSSRFTLIGTLESSRFETFVKLDIEGEIGLKRQIIDVDVNATQVAAIAENGFCRAGITLESKLIEEIKSKWDEFETANDLRISASPLPLACLWFAQLFNRFEDKARIRREKVTESSTTRAFQDTEFELLRLDEIEGGVSFENTISCLADAAWVAAGNSLLSPDRLDEDEINRLNNLLKQLVALDDDGNKRLLSVSPILGDDATTRLWKSFQRRRLLVRASKSEEGEANAFLRYRLVHQAVIDRWPPAEKWFEQRQEYLAIEAKLRQDARLWTRISGQKIRKDRRSIQYAASVLANNYWVGEEKNGYEIDNDILKCYAIAIFENARTPKAVVKTSLFKPRFVHVAARYQLVELLRSFISIDKSCLFATNSRGDSALHYAAWRDGPAVPLLLKRRVSLKPNKNEWHPIEAAIQMHANKNYWHIMRNIDDPDLPIGPGNLAMIHTAARYGNLYVLEDLLSRKVNPNRCDTSRRTALHWAALNGQTHTFVRLLSVCDIEALDENENTPIAIASAAGHVGVVHAFLASDQVSDAVVDRVLRKKNKLKFTPIMQAARTKQYEVVELLLQHCNPGSVSHRDKRNRTLLHLAVDRKSWDTPSDDEKVWTRRTVEVLLNEGKLDPTEADDKGVTAFDLAVDYADARRVIRRDRRMPTEYAKMTDAMRIEDLESRNTGVVLRLLRNAPQALTDLHGEPPASQLRRSLKRNGETGLDILIRAKNIPVLTAALSEGLIDSDLLAKELPGLLKAACLESASILRKALLARIAELPGTTLALPRLLDCFLHDNDDEAIQHLLDLGVRTVRGPEPLCLSVFHVLALKDDLEKFEALGRGYNIRLPLDAWDRKPSDLAPDRRVTKFRAIENEFFTPSMHVENTEQAATKFHELAEAGNIRGFEIQACGVDGPVPRNADGKIPSDLAPEDKRHQFVALEKQYFSREN